MTKHLSADRQQNTDIWCPFTYESWPGSFIAETAPSFSIKRYAKYSVELGLVYKTFVQQTQLRNSVALLKTNCIHVLHNVGFFGKLNKVLFPSQPKTHFFRDHSSPSKSRAAGDEARWWGALCFSSGRCVHGPRSSGRNAHISSSTLVYVKIHDRKNISETCTNPGSKIFGTEILCYTSKLFLKLCPCLAWESNSLNSVNNSECLEQHCTLPPSPL